MATNYRHWFLWAVWGLFTLTVGSAIGTLVGSTQVSAGITMAVVTGMGCVIGIGALVKAIMSWVNLGQEAQGWQAPTVKASFLLGAVNLSVGLVLVPIVICNIFWPLIRIDWAQVGMIIGALVSGLGGTLAAVVEVRALANPIIVD